LDRSVFVFFRFVSYNTIALFDFKQGPNNLPEAGAICADPSYCPDSFDIAFIWGFWIVFVFEGRA
jgi:hypothetical protein